MKTLHFVALSLALNLTACVTISPHKIAPSAQVLSNTITADITTVVVQDEIQADIPVVDSSAVGMQFGLIGALVSSSIDSTTNQDNANFYQTALEPVRQSLNGFKYDNEFHAAINQSIHSVSWLKAKNIKLLKNAEVQEANAPTLEITMNYKFSSDFRYLTVSAGVKLVDPAAPLTADKQIKPIYENTFVYISDFLPVPVRTEADTQTEIKQLWDAHNALPEADRKDRRTLGKLDRALRKAKGPFDIRGQILKLASQWATDQGVLARQHLTNATTEIIQMVQRDMLDTEAVAALAAKVPYRNNGKKYNFERIEENSERLIVRNIVGNKAGMMCSMPKHAVDEFLPYWSTCI